MKKILPLPLVTVLLAAAGHILRRWELLSAFEPDTGLSVPGAPASTALVALVLVSAGVIYLLTRWSVDRCPESYLDAFAGDERWLSFAGLLAVGGLFLAAGVSGVRGFFPKETRAIVPLLLGVAAVGSAAAVLYLAYLNRSRREGQGRFAASLLVPGFTAGVWLVWVYQEHTSHPAILEYVFLVLGIVAAVLACYIMAAFSFEKAQPKMFAWCASMGVILLVTALADKVVGTNGVTTDGPLPGTAMETFLLEGFALYLFVQLCVMLYRVQKPAELEKWAPETPEAEDTPHEEEETE